MRTWLSYCVVTTLALGSIGVALRGARPESNSYQWAVDGTLQTARSGACAVLLADGSVLISGGHGASGTLSSTELFSASGAVISAAPMIDARADHACAALQNGRVLVAGGSTNGGGTTNAAELYDPETKTWIPVAPMASARAGATVSVLPDGRILIAGGNVSGTASATLEIFDAATSRFEAVPQVMSSARMEHAAAVLRDGRVLLAGGSDGENSLNTVDVYDPATGAVSLLGRLAAPRAGLSATTLLDGRVYFAGGRNQAGDLASTEIYDPARDSFAEAAPMSVARRGHLAVRIPNNNSILLAGGTSNGEPSAASELFVPWWNSYKQLPAAPGGQVEASAASLKGQGAVMVAGGSSKSAATGGPVSAVTTVTVPTVTTDKADYSPGEYVTLSGANWKAGEVITFDISRSPTPRTLQLTTTADASGNFVYRPSELQMTTDDVGQTYTINASGSLGSTAQAITFTDGAAATVTFATDTPCAVTGTASGTNNGGNPFSSGFNTGTSPTVGTSPGTQVTYSYVSTVICSGTTYTFASASPSSPFFSGPSGSNTPVTAHYTSDTTPPDTSITANPVNPTNQTGASFSFTGTDNITPAASLTFECQLDGSAFAACTSPKSYSGLSAGSHTFKVRAKDAVGNVDATPASFTWTIDLTAPVVNLTLSPASPTGSNGWYKTQPVGVSVTATDATSNVASVACTDNGSPVTLSPTGLGTPTATASFNLTTDGTHAVVCVATDSVGNGPAAAAGSDNSKTVKIDTTVPDTTITGGPADGSTITTASATFNFNGTDATSGVASFECALDAAAFAACTDGVTYSSLAEGSHTFKVRSIDNAGNADDTPAMRSFKVDTKPPVVNVTLSPASPTGSNGWYKTQPVGVTVTATDATSNVASIACTDNASPITLSPVGLGTPSATASFNLTADGTHAVVCVATDSVGNGPAAAPGSDNSKTVKIDTTVPDTTISGGPADGSTITTASATFNFTGTDATSGVASFECALDAAAFGLCTDGVTYSSLAEGSHTFKVRSIDNAGNADDTPAMRSFKVDTKPPVVNVTLSPASPTGSNGWYKTQPVGVTVTATDATSNVASIACTDNGSPLTLSPAGLATPSATASFNLTTDGTHAVVCVATDSVGNGPAAAPGSDNSKTVKIDTTVPDTTISGGPADGSTITTASATFNFTGTDATSGLASFECALDAAAFAACIDGVTYSSLAEGPHTFKVRSIDNAGNADDTPAMRSFKVDTKPPVVNVTLSPASPTGANGWYKTQPVGVTVTATDATSNVASIACTVDGSPLTLSPAGLGTPTATASFNLTTDGTHAVVCMATDSVANGPGAAPGSDNSKTVKIDTTAPDTTITANPAVLTNSASAPFSFTGSDNLTPPAGLTFTCQLDGGAWTSCGSPKNDPVTSGLHVLQIRATDQAGNTDASPASFTWTVDLFPPAIISVTGSLDPVAKGTPTTITAAFTDDAIDAKTCIFSWGDATSNTNVNAGTVQNGNCSATHSYSAAGIYTVGVTVTDPFAASPQSVFEYVVVYDPNAGFVTGGGWITSPVQSLQYMTVAGKANFGFVSKYERGATVPTGQTEFQFQIANLNFHSTVYEWLVIGGAKAQYKGSGTINNAGNYGFMLTAIDGQINGGGGTDKFRIKIWDKNNGDTVVYDNQAGASDTTDPTTTLGGGSIVIHAK